MEKLLIRKGRQQDIDAVTEIYNEIHTEEEAGLVNIGWSREIYPTRQTAIEALERNDLFVMVSDSEKIIGAAIINQTQAEGYDKANWQYPAEDCDIMVLHTLVISPSVGGNGAGKTFEAFYEQYARENGCHYLRIDTNKKNERARKFYSKLGYTEADIVHTSFNGLEEIELVLLEKRLGE